MRPLGRCGRRRKNGHNKKERAFSQSHNEAFIQLQRWMKQTTETTVMKTCLKLQPCDFPDTGRGMRASNHCRSGDCVVSIPYNLLITTDTVFESIGMEIMSHRFIFTPQQILTIFLTIESVKGNESRWFPYINTLPSMYSTPLYFKTCEMEMMCGKAKELAEAIKERFDTVCQEMKCFVCECFPSLRNVITEDVVKWAWSTVDTRSVFLETKPHNLLNLKPEESNVALAPFLDMLNHSDTAQVNAGLNPTNNCYEITTENKYNKYDQVFISYGPHDNTKLLINYGFTLPHNLNNCYTFSTDDIKSSFPGIEHWDRKLTLLRDCEIHKNLVCTVDGPSWSFMTALKLFALSWEQLSSWKKLLQGISLSNKNDVTATTMAHTLVQEALWKSKRQAKFVKNHSPTDHQHLILSLAIDDVEILEHSLKTLVQR